MVGPNAGKLVAETVLALEVSVDVRTSAFTIHPHPTLTETDAFRADVAGGAVIDISPKRRRKAPA